MRGLLSAALIVRDEETFLPACLASIQDACDEIVIVDTGSADDSVEIAHSYGARVVHHAWNGDFAEARNKGLDLARGEWILYIDADEELAPIARDEVETLLREAHEIAFRLLLKPRPRSTPYREYRLWRNDPRIRFEGVIHEKVAPSICQLAAREGYEIGTCDVLLSHSGYEGDQTHKHLRNLPLLERELELDPANLFNLHHLARVQEGLGQVDTAEQTLERGVVVAREADHRDPLGTLVFAELVRLRRDRGKDGADVLAEGRDLYPHNYMLLFLEARLDTDEGRFEEALGIYDRLLAVDQSVLADAGPSYDEEIFGALAYEGRALCLMRLERYLEAVTAYEAAERCAPGNPSLRPKRQLAQARALR